MDFVKVKSWPCNHEFDVPQLKSCTEPRMITWHNFNHGINYHPETLYGIQFGDKIMCACCGEIFFIDDLNEVAREEYVNPWFDIEEDWFAFDKIMREKWFW